MPTPTASSPQEDEARPGSRARLKALTRQNIVDAARALMNETAGIEFSVDDLAARAGVSRRTVFNHFASLDDVVAAVGAGTFGSIRDALRAVRSPAGETVDGTGDPRAAAVADLVAALRRADLVGQMATLTRSLGLHRTSNWDGGVPQHQAMLLLRALSDLSDDIAGDLARRHPRLSRLDIDLVVGQAMSSLVVLHRYWLRETAAATDAASRAVWADLLDHLVPGATPARLSEGNHG